MASVLRVGFIAAAALVLSIGVMVSVPPFDEGKIKRLNRGMTTNEVIKILGRPSQDLGSRWWYNARRPSFETLILWFDPTSRLEGWTID